MPVRIVISIFTVEISMVMMVMVIVVVTADAATAVVYSWPGRIFVGNRRCHQIATRPVVRLTVGHILHRIIRTDRIDEIIVLYAGYKTKNSRRNNNINEIN